MSNLIQKPRTGLLRSLASAALGIALTAFLLTPVPVSAANLILNGSFESPILVPGSDFLTVPVGAGTITNWTVVGPNGKNVAIIEALYNLPDGAGINFAASNGVQWIDMTGAGANANEGLRQAVSLAPGAYKLSFDVGNVIAPSAALGTQSTVDLWVNSALVQSFTNGLSGGAGINWQQFSYTFSAGGSTSIEFRNADSSGDNFNGLDNVILTAVSTAVPEPSVLAMLICGLILFAVYRPGSRSAIAAKLR